MTDQKNAPFVTASIWLASAWESIFGIKPDRMEQEEYPDGRILALAVYEDRTKLPDPSKFRVSHDDGGAIVPLLAIPFSRETVFETNFNTIKRNKFFRIVNGKGENEDGKNTKQSD